MSRSEELTHGVVVENKYYDDWIKDMPDLTGQVAVVTGANSGTGFWAANALASKGCHVILACRNEAKANSAREEILGYHPDAKLDVIKLDNMDLSTVRSFAEQFNAKYDRLDYLLNNAGIMAQPWTLSKDGFDVQFQTNHLSHFLLTTLLWDKLVKSPGQARVINHSSVAHKGGARFDRNKMQYPYYNWGFLGVNVLMWRVFFPAMGLKPMDNWLRYSVSKLCNVLFTKELQEKISAKGMEDKVISVACHPGYANTNLQNMARDSMSKWEKMNESNSQSAADGSLPLLMATLGKDVKNGQYFGPGDFMEMKGLPKVVKVGGNGNNKKMAKDLWEYSEECVGEKFSI